MPGVEISNIDSPIALVDPVDGNLTTVSSSALTSPGASNAALISGDLSLDALDKQNDGDSDTPMIKDTEDPSSPNKSSESSVKGTPSRKPKRDRKPKVKAIFPGKRSTKYV